MPLASPRYTVCTKAQERSGRKECMLQGRKLMAMLAVVQGQAAQASIKHVPQQRVETRLFMHGQPPLHE